MDTLELRLNERHAIPLKSMGSAGYRWFANPDNPQVVSAEPILSTRTDEPFLPGRSLDEQFMLTGLARGETVIHFVHARSFESTKPPRATYDILVRVTDTA
jgi:predicted secreted protein